MTKDQANAFEWDPDELVTSPDLATDLVCYRPTLETDLTSAIEGATWQALRSLGAV